MKFPCLCCCYKTFDYEPDGSFVICPVCFWEDELTQIEDPTYVGGANKVSLIQAQINFINFRACEWEMRIHVRNPYPGEERDKDWKPLFSN